MVATGFFTAPEFQGNMSVIVPDVRVGAAVQEGDDCFVFARVRCVVQRSVPAPIPLDIRIGAKADQGSHGLGTAVTRSVVQSGVSGSTLGIRTGTGSDQRFDGIDVTFPGGMDQGAASEVVPRI